MELNGVLYINFSHILAQHIKRSGKRYILRQNYKINFLDIFRQKGPPFGFLKKIQNFLRQEIFAYSCSARREESIGICPDPGSRWPYTIVQPFLSSHINGQQTVMWDEWKQKPWINGRISTVCYIQRTRTEEGDNKDVEIKATEKERKCMSDVCSIIFLVVSFSNL